MWACEGVRVWGCVCESVGVWRGEGVCKGVKVRIIQKGFFICTALLCAVYAKTHLTFHYTRNVDLDELLASVPYRMYLYMISTHCQKV